MNNNNDSVDTLPGFIDKLEIVYAILIAWGFAYIAKIFQWDWEYWQYLTICALVLMRFFFAPSRNLKVIADVTRKRPIWQRVIFFWDVPILIAHSFIYYRMCKIVGACCINIPKSYYLVFYLCLLLLNVIWLWSISIRLYFFNKELHPDAKKPTFMCFIIWSTNNFVHIVIFAVLCILNSYSIIDLFGKDKSFLFIFALSNCIVDFFFTAPYYLFDKK